MEEGEELEMIFASIKECLPQGWIQLSEELKLSRNMNCSRSLFNMQARWLHNDSFSKRCGVETP